jgi:hypothetical protein
MDNVLVFLPVVILMGGCVPLYVFACTHTHAHVRFMRFFFTPRIHAYKTKKTRDTVSLMFFIGQNYKYRSKQPHFECMSFTPLLSTLFSVTPSLSFYVSSSIPSSLSFYATFYLSLSVSSLSIFWPVWFKEALCLSEKLVRLPVPSYAVLPHCVFVFVNACQLFVVAVASV